MPYINTTTTAKITDEVRRELTRELGDAIALIPGKSEEWLMLNFSDGAKMAFRGTEEGGAAMLEVSIFGNAPEGALERLTARLCEIVNAHLGIPANRIYVKYTECDKWGFDGFNF